MQFFAQIYRRWVVIGYERGKKQEERECPELLYVVTDLDQRTNRVTKSSFERTLHNLKSI